MRLKISIPEELFLDEEVTRLVAEDADGSFCLLPRHADLVTVLVPGILCLATASGEELVAVDEGILVKRGSEVSISTRSAIRSTALGELEQAFRDKIQRIDERERMARASLARLEATVVRRLVELTSVQP